jgi:large subunit ribosomal protein L25
MDRIKVEKRNTAVSVKQLRREGIVPCNVYGSGLPTSISIQMPQQAAKQIFRTKREGSKVQLELDGLLIPTQIKDKTVAFRNGEIEHITFQSLKTNQKVNSVAHILLKNTDKVSGVLERMLFEVPFASLPEDMIDTVDVDLADLSIGTVLTLRDFPEFQTDRIELQIQPDSIVLRIRDVKRGTAYAADNA